MNITVHFNNHVSKLYFQSNIHCLRLCHGDLWMRWRVYLEQNTNGFWEVYESCSVMQTILVEPTWPRQHISGIETHRLLDKTFLLGHITFARFLCCVRYSISWKITHKMQAHFSHKFFQRKSNDECFYYALSRWTIIACSVCQIWYNYEVQIS